MQIEIQMDDKIFECPNCGRNIYEDDMKPSVCLCNPIARNPQKDVDDNGVCRHCGNKVN